MLQAPQSIPVKVLKETPRHVTILLMSSNSKMRVPKKEFDKRWEKGFYEVINPDVMSSSV